MIEVEQKFRVKNHTSIETRLSSLGYKRSDTVHQADKVFLLNSDNFKTFTPGDPVTRLRTVNGSTTLTFKRAINVEGDSVEHEMTINPASAGEGLLLEMGYKPATNIEKMRTEYKLGEITIALDDVVGLGLFAEVEIVCSEGQADAARKKVLATADSLGLKAEDIETKKYDQLMSELSA